MRITTHIKSILALGFAVFVLSGCSSGSSATGLGLGVGGFWSGTLYRNNAAYANFTMSLIQNSDGDDPFAPSTLTGNFNSSNSCIGSGVITTGTLSGSSIQFAVKTPGGLLNMAGTAGNSSMSGSWSNSGTDPDGGSCNFGGTWSAGR